MNTSDCRRLPHARKELAAPAPSHATVWNRRAGAAFVIVVDSLNAHRESAENEGGLLFEAEVALGQPLLDP